jgi:methylated-DNA-protein-cysteine methyltransferase-like protein
MKKNYAYSRIYGIINQIPRGQVATYGQIAKLACLPRGARQVGYALHRLEEGSKVPWHRVINGKGQISLQPGKPAASLQRHLLETEGVEFNNNVISLKKYQWER